ncbi:alpha-ketoglutarate transmembrane transporter [Aureococcus anophagefferens]|nr:alpha-ketoglutarate transmembrane transporter [Aureococcus anophagefferens]
MIDEPRGARAPPRRGAAPCCCASISARLPQLVAGTYSALVRPARGRSCLHHAVRVAALATAAQPTVWQRCAADAAGGCVGGLAKALAVYPLDRAATRLERHLQRRGVDAALAAALAGLAGAVAAAPVGVPAECCKRRVQLGAGRGAALRGGFSLFDGFAATLARNVPYNAASFGFFALLRARGWPGARGLMSAMDDATDAPRTVRTADGWTFSADMSDEAMAEIRGLIAANGLAHDGAAPPESAADSAAARDASA